MQRLVFSGGARFGFAKTGGGAWLALRAKIGSSVGVKLYQIYYQKERLSVLFLFGS